MKKLLLLTSVFTLIFTSCSKDEQEIQEQVQSSQILIKKMIISSSSEDIDSYWNSTINFSYEGTKLTQTIDEDGYKSVYTYTGDLITKIDYFDVDVLEGQDLFTYNSNGKLIQFRDINFLNDREFKFEYVYDGSGNATVTEYQGPIGNPGVSPFTPDVYVFTNGELSRSNSGTITYDTKNNPFKNVTGYKEIMLPEFTDDYLLAFGKNHNLVSAPSENSTTDGTFATYTYNSSDYPVSSVTTAMYSGSLNGTVNVQYFY